MAIAGVDPDAGSARPAQGGDRARGGQEAAGRVLGVDPALDGVAAHGHVVLGQAERLAGRHPQLGGDDVDAGDLLGDRVLDLDAGVHLQEPGAARGRVPEELDRPAPT